MSGSMPAPVSRTDGATARPAAARRPRPPRPPSAVNLSALGSRLSSTWASRVGSPATQTGVRQRASTADPLGRRTPAGGRSTACRASRPPGRAARPRSWTLPLVIRDTSSRSSTSRARCVDLPVHHVPDPVHHARSPPAQAEDLQRVADRGQRVAQLVGEHGQELVLPPVGLLGPPARGRSRGRTGRRYRGRPRPGRPGPSDPDGHVVQPPPGAVIEDQGAGHLPVGPQGDGQQRRDPFGLVGGPAVGPEA